MPTPTLTDAARFFLCSHVGAEIVDKLSDNAVLLSVETRWPGKVCQLGLAATLARVNLDKEITDATYPIRPDRN